jgi:hypothetical protein
MTRTQFDYSPAHGPIWGTINGTGAALVIAGAGSVLDMPAWYPLPFAAAGGLATLYVCHRRRASRGNTVFWAACWLVPALWSALTIWLGWSVYGVGGLLAAGLSAGVLGPALGRFEERPPADPFTPAGRDPLYVEWEERITRICGFRQPVTVANIDWWPENVGYTVSVKFSPGAGFTWEALRDRERELAASANNPKGCPVRAADSDYQGSAVLKVTRVNGLKKEILYPREYGPLTVRKAFPLGLLADRTMAMAEVRQSAGLVAGRRGGGKTNILDIFTANLTRCPDAVVWHIDLNGGGMSVPWMLPYVAGLVKMPPIDWVARTPDEALHMTRVALAIAKDRKAAYGALKAQHNTRLLPVSAALPEIVLIVDEGAEVIGEDASAAVEVARNLRTLQRIGRAEAVNVIFSALRATGETIPVPVRKQCALRIGTKVEEDAELDYLFNYDRGLRSADLMYAGCAYIKTEDMLAPAQFKAFHVLPEQIAEIVLATTHLRPALDARAAKVGGRVYAERWQRTRPYLTALAGEDGELELPDPSGPVQPAADGNPVAKLAALTEQFKAQTAVLKERAARPRPEDVLAMDAARVRREAESIFALAPVDPRAERNDVDLVDEQPATPVMPAGGAPTDAAGRRRFVVQLVDQAGAEGMRRADIIAAVKAAGIDVHDATVDEWLKTERDAGGLVSPKQGVWKTPRHHAAE